MRSREVSLKGNSKKLSALGLGMGRIQNAGSDEISHIVRRALVNGINVFDMCAGGEHVFRPVGQAIANVRDRVLLTAHFGAGFDELGEYDWIRDIKAIRRNFRRQLKEMETDYIDLGLLHCVDDEDDWRFLREDGMLNYMQRLKKDGRLRGLGFSTHSPRLAAMMLDSGVFDAMMLNIGDEYDDGLRDVLLEKCRKNGTLLLAVGAGRGERLRSAMEMPGPGAVVAGVSSLEELDELIKSI